jgi:hypothetical protein
VTLAFVTAPVEYEAQQFVWKVEQRVHVLRVHVLTRLWLRSCC